MDATRLDFPNAAFDLVYSFNVFEHLNDPAATFGEMVRVLRPGGVAYIAFTSLRWSPHGAHLYKTVGIPYVTVLFDEADVAAYLRIDRTVRLGALGQRLLDRAIPRRLRIAPWRSRAAPLSGDIESVAHVADRALPRCIQAIRAVLRFPTGRFSRSAIPAPSGLAGGVMGRVEN